MKQERGIKARNINEHYIGGVNQAEGRWKHKGPCRRFLLVALVWLWSAARSTQAATPVFGAAMDFGTGCLLGGAQDKKFVPHVEAAARIRGGETYKIYSLKGKLGMATGGKPAPIGMPCVQTTAITTQPSYTDKEVIALGGNWPGMPRVPAAINVNRYL